MFHSTVQFTYSQHCTVYLFTVLYSLPVHTDHFSFPRKFLGFRSTMKLKPIEAPSTLTEDFRQGSQVESGLRHSAIWFVPLVGPPVRNWSQTLNLHSIVLPGQPSHTTIHTMILLFNVFRKETGTVENNFQDAKLTLWNNSLCPTFYCEIFRHWMRQTVCIGVFDM